MNAVFKDDTDRDVYALAMGKIAMAWNEYHEILGDLFASIFTKSHHSTALEIWHCLDNDRTQRRLLRTAVNTHLSWNKKGVEELNWLLNKTDTLLSAQRNVGVHAPLHALMEVKGVNLMLPIPGPGNRNAKQLYGKEVLKEYAHYEQQLRTICTFATALRFKLREAAHTDDPWPERPTLSGGAS
jgi:hypothetical protein